MREGLDNQIKIRVSDSEKEMALQMSKMTGKTMSDIIIRLLEQGYMRMKVDQALGRRPTVGMGTSSGTAAHLAGKLRNILSHRGIDQAVIETIVEQMIGELVETESRSKSPNL